MVRNKYQRINNNSIGNDVYSQALPLQLVERRHVSTGVNRMVEPPSTPTSRESALPEPDFYEQTQKGRTANIWSSFLNMANSIIGAGIIGLPFALKESGFWFGLFLLFALAWLTDWTICINLKNGRLASRHSYQELMEFTFGHPGKIAISWFQFLFAFGGMCAYNVIVGDTLPHVLRHIFPSLNPSDDPLMELQWMSWLHFFTSRRMLTLLSTVFITYPLCLYRDISKLAKASAIALIALLVIVLVMAIEAPLVPNSIKGNEELRWNFISSGWVQSIGVISFAFVCHHNTFVIINALKTPTLNRSEAVTHISIIVSVIISVTVAVIGYQTFTDKSRGNILNNFPSEGLLINIARLCFGFNMFTTYPLEHFVAREVLENYYFGEQTSLTVNVLLTTVLVFSSLFISLITCNLGIVLELTGGFSATALAFVLPPAMYIKLASGPILSRKKLPHLICIIFGFCVMILSTTLTLSSAFERWNQGLQQTNKNCHW